GGTVRAKRVIVATNGYTDDRLHPGMRDRLLPMMSNVITTRPLSQAELEAQGWLTETPIYDTRNLLFYFRLLSDRRILFGSRGGTRGSAAENNRRRAEMTKAFREFFPAWQEVEISHFWTGLICLSAALTPHIGALNEDPSVGYALAYHGNGVAMGTWSGRAIAQLAAGRSSPASLSAVVRQPLRPFPLPQLRVWYLRAMYAVYGLQDALP
ncbi:MAG TPA: FAD-binding oxidoreductase, partial [Chroococcidiopsis sp.]